MRTMLAVVLVLVGCGGHAAERSDARAPEQSNVQRAMSEQQARQNQALADAQTASAKMVADQRAAAEMRAQRTIQPMPASTGEASPPPEDPCAKTPNHDDAIKLRGLAEQMITEASKPLDGHQSLDVSRTAPTTVRGVAAKTKCAYAAFAGKELADAQTFVARAERWADTQDARLSAEEAARTNTIVPLCQAVWLRDNAKADIVRENNNPSGVRDLHVLHSAGQTVQLADDQIKTLTPAYVAFRKHPFKSWQSEGACVAASKP